MIRTFVFAVSATMALGCQAPAAPVATPPTPSPELANPAPTPSKANAVHGGKATAAAANGTMVTQRPADPNRIPNDAIHAAYRKTGAHAGGQLPSGHPPVPSARAPHAPSAPKAAAGETGVPLPLPLEGPGSADELSRRLKNIPDAKAKAAVEQAFRLTFTLQRQERNPPQAAKLLAPLVEDAVAGATAHRILGYVAVSQGFDFDGALRHYGEAVKRDADYGEAHYALAFMHVRGDKAVGRAHFDRAKALGVPDTRGIERFYPAAAPSPAKQAVDPAP